MLKIVIFDSGWGGELFADFVKAELPVVEVVRVIDWKNAPYNKLREDEARELTERALKPYVGTADVIVLASYEATEAGLEYLREKYPKQKFLGFEMEGLGKIKGKLLVLATSFVLESEWLKRKLQGREWMGVDCDEWPQLIDDGELNVEVMEKRLAEVEAVYTDAVILGCTQLVDVKKDLEKILGWKKGAVVDEFKLVLKNICAVLGLRGGDGKRKK